jgi:hypothetical protein
MRATRRKNTRRRVVRKRSTRKASRRSLRARSVKKGGEKHPEARKLLAPNDEEEPTFENYYNVDFYPLYHLYKNAENRTPDYYELMGVLSYKARKLVEKGVVDGIIGLQEHLKKGYDEYKEKYRWLVANPGKTVEDFDKEYYE